MGQRGSSYRPRRLHTDVYTDTRVYTHARATLFSALHHPFQPLPVFLPTPRSLRNGNIPPRNLIPPPAFLPRAMIYNDIEPAQQHIECTVTRVISSPDTRAVKYRRYLPAFFLHFLSNQLVYEATVPRTFVISRQIHSPRFSSAHLLLRVFVIVVFIF